MPVLEDIYTKASANPKHIVLAEGHDLRIVEGAVRAAQDGLAKITLLGPVGEVSALINAAGGEREAIDVIDPQRSSHNTGFADDYYKRHSDKVTDLTEATSIIKDPLTFANMMVKQGLCDGSLAGAAHSTGDVIRAALRTIGLRPDVSLMSSFFIMLMPENAPLNTELFIFADCALVVDPSAEKLAAIASTTADSTKALLSLEPKIALLSFSTRGSTKHPLVDKVTEAGDILSARRPDLLVESAIQFDAAIIEKIAQLKAPGSSVAGHANILIFPNLEAGNIGYKIAERIGGARAIGPIFQGLAKPANDLSRGCDAQDVYNMIAVTVMQAQTGSTAP